jgi:hypothetical protein
MSMRERWIVYPLLFMTLGIALRDKVVPPSSLQVGEVVCDRLVSKQSECQALLVNGPDGRPVVIAKADAATNGGLIETIAGNGMPQVQLISTPNGGRVATVGRAGRLLLFLGDTGQDFGVFAELPGLGQMIPMTLPWRFGGSPGAMPPPPKKPPLPLGRTR